MLSPTPAALRTMLKASCGQDAGWRKAIESNSFWYSWTVRGRACLKYINMVIINQVNTDIRFAEYSRHLDDQQPVSRAHRSATGWRSTALKPGNDAIPAIGGSPFEGKAFEGEGYYGAERSALELRCGGRKSAEQTGTPPTTPRLYDRGIDSMGTLVHSISFSPGRQVTSVRGGRSLAQASSQQLAHWSGRRAGSGQARPHLDQPAAALIN